MNCDFVSDNVQDIATRSLADEKLAESISHIENCSDCRAALRGAEALLELKMRETTAATDQLFDRIVKTATSATSHDQTSNRFWVGAGFGGAIAASIFALAFAFGWTDGIRSAAPATVEFVVALGEPRQMDLAFETDRQLDGATISIFLSGNIGIDGYGLQRELTWTEDLDAGVNRLSLPIIANGVGGGQMVVRMTHPLSEQVFVINLPAES
jgi:hypothetical protein